jgi:hypothetical protein
VSPPKAVDRAKDAPIIVSSPLQPLQLAGYAKVAGGMRAGVQTEEQLTSLRYMFICPGAAMLVCGNYYVLIMNEAPADRTTTHSLEGLSPSVVQLKASDWFFWCSIILDIVFAFQSFWQLQ